MLTYLIALLYHFHSHVSSVDTLLLIAQVSDPLALLVHHALLKQPILVFYFFLVAFPCLEQFLGFQGDCVGHFLGAGCFESQTFYSVFQHL